MKADAACAGSVDPQRQPEAIMRTKIQGLALSGVLVAGLSVALSPPGRPQPATRSVAARSTTPRGPVRGTPVRVRGLHQLRAPRDAGGPGGLLVHEGRATKDNGSPSGVYMESGQEVFVGSLNGGAAGTFVTAYRFESKWDPDVYRLGGPRTLPAPPGRGERHRRLRGRHRPGGLQGRGGHRAVLLPRSHHARLAQVRSRRSRR